MIRYIDTVGRLHEIDGETEKIHTITQTEKLCPGKKPKYGTESLGDGAYHIIIPLTPYTKKNSQRILCKNLPNGKKTRFVAPSQNFLDYQRDSGIFLKDLAISTPVNVRAYFFVNSRRKVDLTNLNEALHDILVHWHVLDDDNATILVSTDGSRVYYDHDMSGTEVLITPEEPTFVTK